MYNATYEVILLVKIYLVRHCEAEGNKAKIFQGYTDCDISDTGARQLEFLKKRFRDIQIDKAISSPLIRAYKTAVAAVDGKGLDIICDKDFIEMDGGFLEGMPFAKIFSDFRELEDTWINDPQNFATEDGESMREVYARAKKAIHKVAEDPENEGKTLLIATHGAVTKNLLCYIIYGDIEELNSVPWANNTAVSLIIYDDGKFSVEYANDDSHIPQEFMPSDVTKLWEKEEN